MFVVESSVANLMPTRLISLTANDTCSTIAPLPASDMKGPIGIINNGQLMYCGGKTASGTGSNQCWRYDKWTDSWTKSATMNHGRNAHRMHKITEEKFIVTGKNE